MKNCPFCAEQIQDAAIVCRFCQRPLTDAPVPLTSATVATPTARAWSPGVAAVLSVFIPGLGHLYKGHIAIGIVLFAVTIAGYAFLIIPGLLIHLCVIISAYNGHSKEEEKAETVAARARWQHQTTPEQRVEQAATSRRQTFVLIYLVVALVLGGVILSKVAQWADGVRSQQTRASSTAPPDPIAAKATLQKKTFLICRIPAITDRFDAEVSPKTPDAAATVQVTFTRTKPSATDAAAVLRYCGDVAMRVYAFSDEILLTAFYEPPGSTDTLLELPDGSRHLVAIPSTAEIITWNERERRRNK